jgi:hypothetical protein
VVFFGTAHPVQYSLADQQWNYVKAAPLFPVSALLLLLLLGSKQRRTWLDVAALVGSLVILFVLVARGMRYSDESAAGLSVAAVAMASLSIAYICNRDRRSLIVVLATASLIPWAATSGSSNPVLTQLAFFVGVSNMIALAALMMVHRRRAWVSTTACCVSLYLTFCFIEHGMAAPYRLAAPLNMQLLPTRLGWGSELKLDSKTNEFVRSILAVAESGGFCRGDPAIDMSGVLPGVVFAMGGDMPVFPWIFAGYPSSGHFLEQYLKKVGSGTLYRSWLILNENANAFSREQIESNGVDLTRFSLVADLRHPVNGSSVKLYAPLLAERPAGCARPS